MNILETLLSSNSGAIVSQISKQFGLDEQQVQAAAGQLLPALAQGVQKGGLQGDNMSDILKMLQGGNHAQYVDQPETLAKTETVDQGNALLGQIFGSKDVSRAVATKAAQNTGIESTIMKQMLPLLATALMGSLSKQASATSTASPLQGLIGQALGAVTGGSAPATGSNDMMNMIGGLLDTDKDGSYMDDILGMISKKAG